MHERINESIKLSDFYPYDATNPTQILQIRSYAVFLPKIEEYSKENA